MPRLTVRDIATIAIFIGFMVAVGVLALVGDSGWALAGLAVLASVIGLVSRLEFASRRDQGIDTRATRRTVEQIKRDGITTNKKVGSVLTQLARIHSESRELRAAQNSHAEYSKRKSATDSERMSEVLTAITRLHSEIRTSRAALNSHAEHSNSRSTAESQRTSKLLTEVANLRLDIQNVRAFQDSLVALLEADRGTEVEAGPQVSSDIANLRSEIRGMRVAQQLISQTIVDTKQDVSTSSESIARVIEAQSELATQIATTFGRSTESVLGQISGFKTDLAALKTEADTARATAAELQESVTSVQRAVERVIRQRSQLTADLATDVQALSQLLARYSPTAPLPPVDGWALGPAGLLYLADSIERMNARFVVECGSGTSTLWMAMAMRQNGRGRVLALEHQESYAAKTRAVLEAHGLAEWAEVCVCPLVDVATPRGTFSWYDLDHVSLPETIDILLIDGPPGTTGRHARYPAMPLLAPMLSEECLVVVDDADRHDEQEVLTLWAEEWPLLTQSISPGRGIQVLTRQPYLD